MGGCEWHAYLVYIDQNDLVWVPQFDFVLGVHQVGDAVDDIVSFECIVVPYGWANSELVVASTISKHKLQKLIWGGGDQVTV